MLDNVSSGLFAKLASDVTDLECDFIAINWFDCNDEADCARFSDNGYGVAGLSVEQPIDISDDENWVKFLTSLSFRTCTLILEVVMMTV